MRCLVTAGNTREMIDRVRDWGNIFTGNTGYSIAKALSEKADVDLLTSNRAHLDELPRLKLPHPIQGSAFTSHAELRGSLAALLARQTYDAIFMTAAIADYKPTGVYSVLSRNPEARGIEVWKVQNVQAGKVKSTYDELAVLGERTEKIIDLFRSEWNHRGLLIKFKLEVGISKDELLKIADASRKASQADYLVANTLDMVTGPSAGAYLMSDRAPEFIPRDQLPARMVTLLP
jgi:phosphopantothenoylcysteine synthetase/decarboxylase